MGDTTEKVKKPSKFSQIKAEFKKIIWPDKKSAAKQTVAVVVISVILGVIIAIIDYVFKYGFDFLIAL